MMKKFRKACAIILAGASLLALTGCGSNQAYSAYSDAYKKMSQTGSLNVEFDLTVKDDSDTMHSTGNMKMNAQNEVYYEMEINGREIVQYVQNGEIHTFVDGEEQTASINNTDQGVERGNPDGSNEKENSTGFNSTRFLEEFSGMLEAGKIKEMGVLDPIPQNYVKEISSSTSGSDTVYTMTFPEEFLTTLLNKMIKEQTQTSGDTLSFDGLKDFECIATANSDGYLYMIEYRGYTTVTVPASYTGSGSEETFDLHIDLQMEIVDPGTAVEVVIPQ